MSRSNVLLTFALVVAVAVVAPTPGSTDVAAASAAFTVNLSTDTFSAPIQIDGECDLDPTNDEPECTLREAIQEVGAVGGGTVTFGIDEPPPISIVIAPVLPTLGIPITIDGTTQPGYTPGTPAIHLVGDPSLASHPYRDGLYLSHGSMVTGLEITGFPGNGVTLTGTNGNVVVQENVITRNTESGVYIDTAPGSVIQHNEISGNGLPCNDPYEPLWRNGIEVHDATGTLIRDNMIGAAWGGTVADGTTGNGCHGIYLDQATSTVIGAPNHPNVISANGGSGIEGIGTGVFVEGNMIGTDILGTVDHGNGRDGIALSGTANVIGGSGAGQRNVISGNDGFGVRFGGMVLGNHIGVDRTGTYVISNTEGGVDVTGDTVVGGPDEGDGNVIGGNEFGILARGGRLIQGNRIGIGPGDEPVGNNTDGIRIDFNTHNLEILDNTIAFNGTPGVGGDGVTGQRFVAGFARNSIHDNVDLGIDFFGAGPTPNDPFDNGDLLNHPYITAAVTRPTETTISGRIQSYPGLPLTIELFASDDCDPSGYGEAGTWLGQVQLTTAAGNPWDPGAGLASFTLGVPPVPRGLHVTAMSFNTSAPKSVSELSPCTTVQGTKVTQVSVSDAFGLVPAKAHQNLGGSVQWNVAGPKPTTIERTGVAAFKRGPAAPGAAPTRRFNAAGTYSYVASTDSSAVSGSIGVPVAVPVGGLVGQPLAIRWAKTALVQDERVDVDVRPPGAGFTRWRTRARSTDGDYTPGAPGTYTFRARLRTAAGATKWSPLSSVTVT